MFRTALAAVLIALAVAAATLFSSVERTPTERDPQPLLSVVSPALAGGFQDGVLSAENSIAQLSRVAVSVIDDSTSGDRPGTDSEWSKLERTRSSPSLFVRMRSNREVAFRDELLNPGDVYVDPESRAALNTAFADAIQRVERLRSMRMSIANEQILALASEGRFAPWKGKAFQLAGRVSDNPTGEGWYTFMTSDGTQYKVQWNDLTWTKEAEQLATALELQIDAMVADFFVRRCGLSTRVRDLVFTYGLGDGPNLLRELARENPQEYMRVRQVLIGR